MRADKLSVIDMKQIWFYPSQALSFSSSFMSRIATIHRTVNCIHTEYAATKKTTSEGWKDTYNTSNMRLLLHLEHLANKGILMYFVGKVLLVVKLFFVPVKKNYYSGGKHGTKHSHKVASPATAVFGITCLHIPDQSNYAGRSLCLHCSQGHDFAAHMEKDT